MEEPFSVNYERNIDELLTKLLDCNKHNIYFIDIMFRRKYYYVVNI